MLHTGPNYHNVIISYYNNILITLTNNQAFCTLRIPCHIGCNALFNHGYHPIQPLHKIYVSAHMFITRAPRGPQTWFWRHSTWNFTRKKMSYLPRRETHNNKLKKQKQYHLEPKNDHNSGPWASPRARIWHAPSYHIPRRLSLPKGTQF